MRFSTKIIACGSIITVLEAYDFLLYGIFVHEISNLFFPKGNYALLSSLVVFATGFIARPLGAYLIGSIGDYISRKKALVLSAFLMAIPTFGIGILPSFEQYGWIITILLIFFRILQGFSVGGEFNGAAIFVIENSRLTRSGFVGSLVSASGVVGSLLALGIAYIVSLEFVPAWGWRLPFLASILLAISGIILRLKILEYQGTGGYSMPLPTHKIPFKKLIFHNKEGLIIVACVGAFNGMLAYILFAYLGIHLRSFIHTSFKLSVIYNYIGLISFLLSIFLFGWLSDKHGCEKLMITGGIAMILFSYPFYYGIQFAEQFKGLNVMSLIMFGLLAGLYVGPSNAFMNKMFSTQTRYRGISLSFSLGIALFGGTAPMVNAFLIQQTQNVSSPCLSLLMCGGLGAFAPLYIHFFKRKK